MKTKAQIVQELLDERKITAEDAVVLLTPSEKEYIYVPQQPNPYPTVPYSPWETGPRWINSFPNYSTTANVN